MQAALNDVDSKLKIRYGIYIKNMYLRTLKI